MIVEDLFKEEKVFNLKMESETYLPVLWTMYDAYLESLIRERGPQDELYNRTSEFYNDFASLHNDQKQPEVLNLSLTLQKQINCCVVLDAFIKQTKKVADWALQEEKYELVSSLSKTINSSEKMIKAFKLRDGAEINIIPV